MTKERINEIKDILSTERSVAYSIYLVFRQITDKEKRELGIFDEMEYILCALDDIDCRIGMDIERTIKEFENSSD